MLKEKLGLHCCSFAMIWKANRKVQKFLGKSSTTICFLNFFSTATWPGIEKWKQSKISSLHTKVAADRSAQSQTTVFKKLLNISKCIAWRILYPFLHKKIISNLLLSQNWESLGLNSSWRPNTLVLEQPQKLWFPPKEKEFCDPIPNTNRNVFISNHMVTFYFKNILYFFFEFLKCL